MRDGAEEEEGERARVSPRDERQEERRCEREGDGMGESAVAVRRAVGDAELEGDGVEVGEDRGHDRGDGDARGRVARLQKGRGGM